MNFRLITRQLSVASKLRTPAIKFRYGPGRDVKSASVGTGNTFNQTQTKQSSAAIYDFQLPSKYRRKQLSEEEIEYINRGGRDV